MSPAALSALVKSVAAQQGFCRAGIAPAAPLTRADYYRTWLADGRHGRMAYLARNLALRLDPRGILPGTRSFIVVADSYRQPEPPKPNDQPRGRVAMYAWGRDYHKVVKKKLRALCDRLRRDVAEPFETRICVDTAPIVERELAALAGVGWIGKNTMVIDPAIGSYFFLGVVATTLDLAPDAPMTDHCGTCTRCLEACPTQAFPRPYEMDASRCISYFTIELREEIPVEFHHAMGDWVFGCDVCQQVCPYNRGQEPPSERRGLSPPCLADEAHCLHMTAGINPAARPAKAPDPFSCRAPNPYPPLRELANWTKEDYDRTLAGSAMKRATLPMLRRNAQIAIKNADSAGG